MEPLLELADITLRFPGVIALRKVDVAVERGEVHALVGANGAGKSSLVKVLAGVYRPDDGEIRWKGERLELHNPRDARDTGISFVHQETVAVPSFTTVENIFLGEAYPRNKLGLIDMNVARHRISHVAEELGITEYVDVRMRELPPAIQRMVMIARSLYRESELVVMDEPTAALSAAAATSLFHALGVLKRRDVAVIYISHRLEEIFELADRVTVMRDGEVLTTKPIRSVDKHTLVSLIAPALAERQDETADSRKAAEGSPKGATRTRNVLEVRNLHRGSAVCDVSFDVSPGEIVGLAGLVGSGRTELVRLIFGADRADGGTIKIDGRELVVHSPSDAIRAGIVLLPENRRHHAIIPRMSVRENFSLPSLSRYRVKARVGLLSRRREGQDARKYIERYSIRTAGSEQRVVELSGGNQQKVVFARWVNHGARVFIFDEPTQGIDVGTRADLFVQLQEVAQAGAGVIMISSDLDEIVAICDRAVIMSHGRVVGNLERDELSVPAILRLCYFGSQDETRGDVAAGEQPRIESTMGRENV